MKLLELFAGIGAFSLAAHRLGWETIGFVERDEFCQKVLRKNFNPDIPLVEDIFDVTTESFQRPDVITAGFPCQPYSAAGLRRGVRDERALFPRTLEVIEMFRPDVVVLENVTGLFTIPQSSRSTKLESHGVSRGERYDRYEAVYLRQEDMLLGSISDDLENAGYEVQTVTVPAVASGADHKRDRIWIVAFGDSESGGSREKSRNNEEVCRLPKAERQSKHSAALSRGANRDVGNTEGKRPGEAWESFERSEKRIAGANNRDVGDSDRKRRQGNRAGGKENNAQRQKTDTHSTSAESDRNAPDSDPQGLQRINERTPRPGQSKTGAGLRDRDAWHFSNWYEAATVLCGISDGIPAELHEFRRDNRTARLKALGNSIHVPTAYAILKAINDTIK